MSNHHYSLTEDEMEKLRHVANLGCCVESIAIMRGDRSAVPDMKCDELLALLDGLCGPVREVMTAAEARGLTKSPAPAAATDGPGQPAGDTSPSDEAEAGSVTVDIDTFQWLLRALEAAPQVLREGHFARAIGSQIMAGEDSSGGAAKAVAHQWREHIQPLLDAPEATPAALPVHSEHYPITYRISEEHYNSLDDTMKLSRLVSSLACKIDDRSCEVDPLSLFALLNVLENNLQAVTQGAEHGHWTRPPVQSGSVAALRANPDDEVDQLLDEMRAPMFKAWDHLTGSGHANSTGGA